MSEDKRDREDKGLLPFTSGRLVSDYSLLKEYWRKAREKGREDLVEASMLREEDYSRLRDVVAREGRIGLADLWDKLTSDMEARIDAQVAVEAARARGINAAPGQARRLVARQLAAWLIEAAEFWKFVRLRDEKSGGLSGENNPGPGD